MESSKNIVLSVYNHIIIIYYCKHCHGHCYHAQYHYHIPRYIYILLNINIHAYYILY